MLFLILLQRTTSASLSLSLSLSKIKTLNPNNTLSSSFIHHHDDAAAAIASELLQLPNPSAAPSWSHGDSLRSLPGCHPHRRPSQCSASSSFGCFSILRAAAAFSVAVQPRASGPPAERAREEEGGDSWDIVQVLEARA